MSTATSAPTPVQNVIEDTKAKTAHIPLSLVKRAEKVLCGPGQPLKWQPLIIHLIRQQVEEAEAAQAQAKAARAARSASTEEQI